LAKEIKGGSVTNKVTVAQQKRNKQGKLSKDGFYKSHSNLQPIQTTITVAVVAGYSY